MTENHPAATSTGRGTKGAVSESGSMPQRALYRANWSRTVQPDARQNWEANTGELQAGRSFKCRGGDSIGTALVDSPTTRQERVTPRSSRKRTESTALLNLQADAPTTTAWQTLLTVTLRSVRRPAPTAE